MPRFGSGTSRALLGGTTTVLALSGTRGMELEALLSAAEREAAAGRVGQKCWARRVSAPILQSQNKDVLMFWLALSFAGAIDFL